MLDKFFTVYDWVYTHIPPWVYIAIVAHLAILGCVAYLILLERKIASWVQDRIGPNRVGFDFGLFPFLKGKFGGLGQPLADGIKFIVKEDYRPKHVDKILFTIAPAVMIIVVIISIAVLPWGGWKQDTKEVVLGPAASVEALGHEPTDVVRNRLPVGAEVVDYRRVENEYGVLHHGEVVKPGQSTPGTMYAVAEITYRWPFQIANLNIGVLYVLAVLSLAVYGVVIGGWASNNKYSFLGGLRATANMISYEIPLGLAVLAVVVMFGTLNLDSLVTGQAHYWLGFIPAWNVFSQPLAFLLFLICIHAEANRAPFDMAEAEQELVGGYHTEYSAMRFALFFLAEYAGMITTSAVCVALFFGGWHLPWVEWIIPGLRGETVVDPNNGLINVTSSVFWCILRSFIFFGKTLAVIFVFMWVRWSLPRFRFDQLMMLAWRALIPISLALVMVTAVVIYLLRHVERAYTVGGYNVGPLNGWEAFWLFVANVGVFVVAMGVSLIIPPAPATNRKIAVPNSRFRRTPLPGTPVAVAPVSPAARDSVPRGRRGASGGVRSRVVMCRKWLSRR